MKRIIQYAMYALVALAGPLALLSCNDDKDIVVIDKELPLKVSHLYMVGDATPAGWSIDNPTELTQDTSDKFVFTYHGKLNTGELKFPFSTGDWGATFAYAPEANTEINASGVASDKIDIRKGGDDLKWKVTLAGIYTITINLRDYTIAVKYEGAEPVTPIVSETLGFIGDATPAGWATGAATMFTKTSDSPLQFTYTGHLNAGSFKLAYDKTVLKDFAGPYIQAPSADVAVSGDGVAEQGMTEGGADNKWKVTEAGTYTLVFDLTNRTVTVTSFTADPVKDVWSTETLYLLGDAGNGWSIGDAPAFTKDGDHKFVYDGNLNEGSFKLMSTNVGDFGTEDKDWFYAPANGTIIDENGVAADGIVAGNGKSDDNQWKVSKAGHYVITVDMENHKISAEYVGSSNSKKRSHRN